ncbi:MAG: RidA family protein [Gemmatimonadales bacterium]
MPDARREVIPEGMARPGGHYSHAAVGAGLVFVSGQLATTPAGIRLNDQPFDTQVNQTLANVAAALAGAGSSIEKLLSVRVYLADIEDWAAFNVLYAAWAGNARPARAVVPVPALHYGFRIEIEAVALA